MNFSEPANLAEGAFVNAVVEALKVQESILELRLQLQEIDKRAENANEAALRELGYDEATPPELIVEAQERFLTLAIERSELPEESPVIQAARQQVRNFREAVDNAVVQEAQQLGGFRGPAL